MVVVAVTFVVALLLFAALTVILIRDDELDTGERTHRRHS